MNILDNHRQMKKFNQSQIMETLSFLPDQLAESWSAAGRLKLPPAYRRFKNIVVCGMGGSNLASEFIRSVFKDQIKLPLILWRDYHLPAFVGPDSLVVISSYSGETAETLSCLAEALAKKAKIFCLSSGGRLMALAQKNKLPFYLLDKKFNPSGQPRYGLGSQLGALLAIFSQLKIIKLDQRLLSSALADLKNSSRFFGPASPLKHNPAKQLARELYGFMPLILSADFLAGNAHILNNQINESAKNLAQYHLLPEANHYLLEGLKKPEAVAGRIKFLLLFSGQYPAIIQKRFSVTRKILAAQKIKTVSYAAKSRTTLGAALETLALDSWLSFYLAVLNKQKPALVPWVEMFKKELKK